MPHTSRCPACRGGGTVRGPAGYPGTGAYRPLLTCRDCDGTGIGTPTPPPGLRPYRVRFAIIVPAEGGGHADTIANELVREALSSVQYNGTLRPGHAVTVIRDPAQEAEEL